MNLYDEFSTRLMNLCPFFRFIMNLRTHRSFFVAEFKHFLSQ